MKASSESGECASLISTGDFSVFEAVCLAAIGWVFLVLSWALFFPERRSAPRGRRRETDGKGRAHRWGLRGAGPDDFSTQSLAYWGLGDKLAQLLARRGRAWADAENIGNRPGDRVCVVFSEGRLKAAKHLELHSAGLQVQLGFWPAFEVLGGYEPDAGSQQFLIQIVHGEWRVGKQEQNAAGIVFTQGRFAPLPLLLAPLVQPGPLHQPQVLHNGGVIAQDGLESDPGSVQVQNAKARRRGRISWVKGRNRLILVLMCAEDVLVRAEEAEVSFLVCGKHARVDGRGKLLLLAPLASGVTAGLAGLAGSNHGQLPEIRVHPQNREARISRGARRFGRDIAQLHAGSKSLPAGSRIGSGAR